MSKDFKGIISDRSPRHADWLRAFGTDEVYLTSFLPAWGKTPDGQQELFYMLDIEELTKEQRAGLITVLAEKFHLPEREVDEGLAAQGCPILVSDVVVAISNPLRWL